MCSIESCDLTIRGEVWFFVCEARVMGFPIAGGKATPIGFPQTSNLTHALSLLPGEAACQGKRLYPIESNLSAYET
jgi:hypothetical protein